ncbi:uncharacterized protein LOC101857798 [Aplysia californica]|uniref:Uncharacterized protein LOC101857798 n=1 Tax=Aplysia californica TaxID=6500 RepID=A0ABM0JPL4_APLCA|nr:uncharacterized protein LOC101857798 [Aplysia californica]
MSLAVAMASTEQTPDFHMLHLQAAVEHNSDVLETILRTLQDVQYLSVKTDKRVGALETQVKELLSRNSQVPLDQVKGCDLPASAAQATTLTSPEVIGEIMDGLRGESTEVKSLIREEAGRLGDICSQHHSDVVSKLEKAEELILPPRSEMAAEIVKMTSHFEGVENGMRTIENSTNEYLYLLNNVHRNLIPKEELTNTLKTLTEASEKQLCQLNKIVKEHDSVVSSGNLSHMKGAGMQVCSRLHELRDEFGTRWKTASRDDSPDSDREVAECHGIQGVVETSEKNHEYRYRFGVKDFSRWRWGESQYSDVWHIGEDPSHVKGVVKFSFNNEKIAVGLRYSRCLCPQVVGSGLRGKTQVAVTVTALCQVGKGWDWKLGSKEGEISGEFVDWEEWLVSGDIPISELKRRGLVNNDQLVLQYQICLPGMVGKVIDV